MELRGHIAKCSTPACILLLAGVLATCYRGSAGEPKELPLQRLLQLLAEEQQQRAAQQKQRAVKQQQVLMNLPQLLLVSGASAAALRLSADVTAAQAGEADAADMLLVLGGKQQHGSLAGMEEQRHARERRRRRRRLQPHAAPACQVSLESSRAAEAAPVALINRRQSEAAQPTTACPANPAVTAPIHVAPAAGKQCIQRRSWGSEGNTSNKRIMNSGSSSCTWGRSNVSSSGRRGGKGEAGLNRSRKGSRRRARSNSSSGSTHSLTDHHKSRDSMKRSTLSRRSTGQDTGGTKREKSSSGSSKSSKGSEKRLSLATEVPGNAITAVPSAFASPASGRTTAAVVVGAAAAEMLAFFAVRGIIHSPGSAAATAVSLAAAVAMYPFSAAATASPIAKAVSSSSSLVPCSSSLSSFASCSPPLSSSSSSSVSKSPAVASARPGVAESHASLSAAAQSRDDAGLQQNSQTHQPAQQQARGLYGGVAHQQQRHQPLTVHRVEQQQREDERAQAVQLSIEPGTSDGGVPLRSIDHQAKISLRRQQQEGKKEKDDGGSHRVRFGSRSLYAAKGSLLHVPAAPAGRRTWQAVKERESEAVYGSGGPKAAQESGEGAATDEIHNSVATAEETTAATEKLATTEKHVRGSGSSSTEAGLHGEAAGSLKSAVEAVQQKQEHEHLPQRQSRQEELAKEQQQSGEGGMTPEPRETNAGRAGMAQLDTLPKDEARIALVQQGQWREGVDNKRFPCVMRGMRTEGSMMRQFDGVRTEHKCQRLCRREKSCTHAILNTENNTCALKPGIIDPVPASPSSIVIPYNCADCWELRTSISGSAFLSRSLYSPFGCVSYCLSQPQCNWWQYSIYEEKCLLFSNVSQTDLQRYRHGQVSGRRAWCSLTDEEQKELALPEEGDMRLGSGWIKSQCMQPPHTKSTGVPFEQFSNMRSADLCQKECQKRWICRYFDFNRQHNICRLFEKQGYVVEPGEGYVAGPRTCNMTCFIRGRKISSEDVGILATESVDTTMECQVKCNEDTRCRRFSFCVEDSQCTLSKIGPPRPQKNLSRGLIPEEEETDRLANGAPEFELSYQTTEATGCYVGPATFCTPVAS